MTTRIPPNRRGSIIEEKLIGDNDLNPLWLKYIILIYFIITNSHVNKLLGFFLGPSLGPWKMLAKIQGSYNTASLA